MAPEIADWPSRYFYGGKISHGAPARETGMKPCLLVKVVAEMRQAEGSHYNKGEEKVVMAAVDAVRELNRDLNIGVITFYSQPVQSPDINIKDLVFFCAITALTWDYSLQDTKEFKSAVLKAYIKLPLDTCKKVWITLQMVMNEIICVDGNNNYQLPHASWDKIV